MSGKEAIPFNIKGPIPVQLSDAITSGDQLKKTGCAIVDLNFQYPCQREESIRMQIGELVLCNYYTAWMSVYVKRMINSSSTFQSSEKDSGVRSSTRVRPQLERSFTIDISDHGTRPKNTNYSPMNSRMDDADYLLSSVISSGGSNSKRRHSSEPFLSDDIDKPWECCIQMKTLMPYPHFESGSQDVFSIPATESMVEWRDVVVMRLVIHQPSTVWKRFSIEDVNVFRHLPKRGFSHYDDLLRQRDNWFSVLRKNTKAMLSGQLVVEPENRDSDDGAE